MKDSIFDIETSTYLPGTNNWSDHQILYYRDGVLYYSAFTGFSDSYSWSDYSITVNCSNSYYFDDGGWISTTVDDTILLSSVHGQSLDPSRPNYFSVSDLNSGAVPYSYSSSAFAAMETNTPLDEIISILPVCIPVLILYAAIRKGLSWMHSFIKKA